MKLLLILTILINGYAFSISSCNDAKNEVLKYNKGQSSINELANGKDIYRYKWLASSTQSFRRLTANKMSDEKFTLRLKRLNVDAKCVIQTYNTVLADKVLKDSSTTLNKYQNHLRSDAPKYTNLGGYSNQYRNTIIDHYHYMSMVEQL